MILFDVNILIYAHREDQRFHEYFRSKLEAEVSSGRPFGLSELAAGGFIRIVTQPNFPNGPTPLPQALAVIDSLMSMPASQWVMPGKRHYEIFSALCRQTHACGKLVADAQHAAIAIEHAAKWITRDKDFEQFVRHGLNLQTWNPEGD